MRFGTNTSTQRFLGIVFADKAEHRIKGDGLHEEVA
jgi:hypothetical protein